MIACIIIVGLAFIWLGYETDWMRVRLPRGRVIVCETGACCEWRLSDNAVTREMKNELLETWFGYGLWHGNQILRCHLENGGQPLCGWGYAYQYRNFVPESKVELITDGYHCTMTIKNPAIFKDVLRVYRNPYAKVSLKRMSYWEMATSYRQLCASLVK